MNHTQLKLTPQRDSHTSRLTNYFSSVPEKKNQSSGSSSWSEMADNNLKFPF